MNTRFVRAFLALLVVGIFMLITACMALFPLLGKSQVSLNSYADFFSKTASVYTGIVGVIIGYYFGKAEQPSKPSPVEGEQPKDKAPGGAE